MSQLSTAVQVIVSVIPIVGIVVGGVVIFFYLLWQHQRRTMLIKNGQYQKPVFDVLSFSLLAGLLLGLLGLALTVLLALLEGLNYALLGGIIPLSIGVGLLSYYLINRSQGNHSRG